MLFLCIFSYVVYGAELSEEQQAIVRSALHPVPQDQVLVSGFNVSLTRRDLQTLKGLSWLNDEIVNFYMSLIVERSDNYHNSTSTVAAGGGGGGKQQRVVSERSSSLHRAYAFTTFFYPKLIKDGFASLKRWTRKVDIFAYDVLIVPVHLGMHWTLAIVDMKCKEIRYYDSMNGNNAECLRALRNYLRDEHADKKSSARFDITEWTCLHVKDIPQQMNGSDCGMFACKFAEFISRGKFEFNFTQACLFIHSFILHIHNLHCKYFLFIFSPSSSVTCHTIGAAWSWKY